MSKYSAISVLIYVSIVHITIIQKQGNKERSMEIKAYSPQEVRTYMDSVRSKYQFVRLVDPDECRTLFIDENNEIQYGDRCFKIWNGGARCQNCVSFKASHTWKKLSARRVFGDKKLVLTTTPIHIRTDKALISCSIEICSLEEKTDEEDEAMFVNSTSPQYVTDHDPLTGLLNMEGFYRAAREEIMDNPGEKYVILDADISHFGMINAMYGRSYGDSVLISIAEMMNKNKKPHTVFARDNSDGFLILKRKETINEESLKNTLDTLEKKFSTSSFRFAIHMGIYEVTETNLPMALMVERAVMAMKVNRESMERKISWFDERMLEKKLHDQQVVSMFDQKLKENQFLLYLQPQVDIQGHFLGAEALVRAKGDNDAIIAPAEFLSVLEKSEQICKLDLYIWERAVQTLAKWSRIENLKDKYISINVSPRELYSMDVPKTLRDLCAKYLVVPKLLHVEILEISVLDDIRYRARNIERLHQYGFIAEIDDFGKGSSSLAMLSQSDADVLKIDRDFVRSIDITNKAFYVLQAVISLTDALHMRAIVEGVETEKQLSILKQLGCTMFQGFYFDKPMPEHELTARFA